ncbi:MAG: chemotaxis protein CheW [Gammaproteobacteria bacterium]|nr:MAG: chemotaxis protein CheW [Gammaproteobacteria bacterium]
METVRCLFIPTVSDNLLIPNAAIAEITNNVDPHPLKGRKKVPEWLLGTFEWREQVVPLISLEAINGEEIPAPTINTRIAVLKAHKKITKMPYMAIVTQKIPKLVTIYDEGIEHLGEDKEVKKIEAAHVLASGEPAVIPDLDEIEKMVLKHYT